MDLLPERLIDAQTKKAKKRAKENDSHGRVLYPRKTDFRWLPVETLAREESADGDVELACCRAALQRSDTTLVCR
jgi:hypothetical protein